MGKGIKGSSESYNSLFISRGTVQGGLYYVLFPEHLNQSSEPTGGIEYDATFSRFKVLYSDSEALNMI